MEITRKEFFSACCFAAAGLIIPKKKEPVKGCRYCPLWTPRPDIVGGPNQEIKDKFGQTLTVGVCSVTERKTPQGVAETYSGLNFTWSDDLCWWKAQEHLDRS